MLDWSHVQHPDSQYCRARRPACALIATEREQIHRFLRGIDRASLRAITHHLRFLVSVLALAFCAISTHAQNANVTINVDATVNRHPINPNIYGVAHATTTQLNDLNCPLNRNGGNNTTRYNWQLNADNRGSDWYFESIGDTSATAGERGDTFIASWKSPWPWPPGASRRSC